MKVTHKKGEPLKLPNGTIIKASDEGTEVVTSEEQEAEQEIDDVIADPFTNGDTYQRTLADVRVEAKEFNPVMLVLGYSMWGLDANAISRFLNLDTEMVEGIIGSDLYVETRKELLEAIRFAENASIHGYLSQQARTAAITLASGMKSKSMDVKLSAANSVLDRAGFRPVDRTEHVHKFDDELRIKYVKEGSTPNIDVGV